MEYKKICIGCGKPFIGEHKDRVFCSHSCSNANRNKIGERAHYDHSLNWVKADGLWECPYQMNVGCTFRKCDKCGWNPKVAEARTKAFMEKYNGD